MNLSEQFKDTPDLGLHSIFEQVAIKYKDKPAISMGNYQLSYEQLDIKASKLATVLIKEGVKKGDLVCLCIKRSVEMIIGTLAILKAGAAYVPIDPNYPLERCNQIITSSGANFIIIDNDTKLPDVNCRIIDVNAAENGFEYELMPSVATTCKDLAYVIFTSGSTGEPKGSMIEHGNVTRLFTELYDVYTMSQNDVWTNFHSIAFDFSVWEIWGALLFGGRLVIVPNEIAKNPEALHQLLLDEKVTMLNQTPTSFRNLIPVAISKGSVLTELRYIIFGGERLDYQILKPWANLYGVMKPQLVNMYGITETTVHATWKLISYEDINNTEYSLIGKPINDMKIIIVENGKILPVGEKGVMYVSGPGVTRGYLKREDLTKKRFVSIEGTNERWFNSGDIGIQLGDNEFAYIGRADRQLKVSGYRIEPFEIESRIREYPNVQDCIVLSKDYGEGDIRLVSYVVPTENYNSNSNFLADGIREYVSNCLPKFMQPSVYFIVKTIPTTINDKMDTEALNNIEKILVKNDSPIKEKLKSFWAEILEIENVEENIDFMCLGGTSFSLIRMLRTVNKHFEINIQLNMELNEITINSLSEIVTSYINKKL
ncbi:MULTISPECIES: amino acid adenylation domain-containing protein [unclassified Clostridium]|uniref:amino acid adenylation domain-containing protein n=1 Tax=unclassified Clostridium TaxID=2614128 RepID=UPI0025BDFCFD|nr:MULTISPECIES: amino acid adenylation domain-containing protein [unclassified Clostridium]